MHDKGVAPPHKTQFRRDESYGNIYNLSYFNISFKYLHYPFLGSKKTCAQDGLKNASCTSGSELAKVWVCKGCYVLKRDYVIQIGNNYFREYRFISSNCLRYSKVLNLFYIPYDN
ncbi:hypothetical protein R6Q57_009649 [Mikania cordata]